MYTYHILGSAAWVWPLNRFTGRERRPRTQLKQTACPTKASLRSEIQEELDTELLYEYDEETSEHQCIPTALVMDGSLEPRVTPGQATLADVVDRAEREYEEKQINKLITEYELIDHQTETAGGMEDDADFEMVNPDRCMLWVSDSPWLLVVPFPRINMMP